MRHLWRLGSGMAGCLWLLACAGSASAGATAGDAADSAGRILEATGVKGGLVVHVGCGDGKLTAALRVNDGYLVHGLDTDGENVRQARAHIQSLDLYGRMSVDGFDGLAAANGRLYMSATDGRVRCLTGR
jgi:hypothetical protein